MDDIDIFKHRTQYGPDKKPIHPSKLVSQKGSGKPADGDSSNRVPPAAASIKKSAQRPPSPFKGTNPTNFDGTNMEFSEDNDDFRYVSFLTQLTTLRERNHPLRHIDWIKGTSDLKIFDNVPFGPKIEYNKQLYNLNLKMDENIKANIEQLKIKNTELAQILVHVDNLRLYRDVGSYKDEMRIAELKEKIARHSVSNKRMMELECERHEKSMSILDQKMYRTIDDIHVSAYQVCIILKLLQVHQ